MFKLVDMLFGCTHKRYTFPMTTKSHQWRFGEAAVTGVYVVCLDCGREFAYDWDQMKVLSATNQAPKTLAAPSEVITRVA